MRTGWKRQLFLIFFAVAAISATIFLGLKFGPLPVAVADSAFPFEKKIVKIPLRARIDREMKAAPFDANEDIFESGAHIYRQHCAICHGTPGHDSAYSKSMYPAPPQLWKKHGAQTAVGVSEYDPGLAYWFVANGVRLTGMPSYKQILSESQMWQVSLLLKNADQNLSSSVTQILNDPSR